MARLLFELWFQVTWAVLHLGSAIVHASRARRRLEDVRDEYDYERERR